ncbi:MAG TPA: ATP-dependent 6-phosphofructokinase [Firmicutes bacterium]|nr:ATP-dependent 6-phosphofructokinase [Bacillota bacterium]
MKIGVLTGGGDCPGLNAVIRGVVKSAHREGIEIIGIYDGFKGLMEKRYQTLTPHDVQGILPKGGTILGTTNRDNPFHYPVKERDSVVYKDESKRLLANVEEMGLDSVIVIGGDGTMNIAHEMAGLGLKVVGVPKTIDNDLSATDQTFGFETAVNTATDAIDKLHTTAESHHRVMILELMGRDAGFISLYAGLAGGADIILIPEIPFTIEGILKKVHARAERGSHFSIIVVSEGCQFEGKQVVEGENQGNPYNTHRLGGIGEVLAAEIQKVSNLEVRTTVLGHLQRGGSPAPFDRILSSRYGVAALEAAKDGVSDRMVCLRNGEIHTVSMAEATHVQKSVDPMGELVKTARMLDISFGD